MQCLWRLPFCDRLGTVIDKLNTGTDKLRTSAKSLGTGAESLGTGAGWPVNAPIDSIMKFLLATSLELSTHLDETKCFRHCLMCLFRNVMWIIRAERKIIVEMSNCWC